MIWLLLIYSIPHWRPCCRIWVLVAVKEFVLHPGSHDVVKWCIFLFYKNKLIGCECLLLIPRNVETVHAYISHIIKAVKYIPVLCSCSYAKT